MKALVSSSPLLRASRLLVAAGLAWTVLAGLAAGNLAARRTAALGDDDRIVIGSNRDGVIRAYSLLSDGSRLTPLLRASRLVPVVVSRNGATVVYTTTWYGEGPMYVSDASGKGLRRLAKGDASGPALSRDGKWLAFSPERGGISLVRTDGRGRRRLMARCDCGVSDWAPNGRSVVLNGGVETTDGSKERISVLPLRGKRRIVARMGENTGQHADHDGAAWSPDGRWIAYLNLEDNNRKIGLYLVRPNGSRLHRLVRGAVISLAWSPDGKKLAFIYENGQLAVVGVDGRGLRRLPLGLAAQTVAWSPDGQRLAVAAPSDGGPQIFVAGGDGRDARRVTAEGDNSLIGWTTRAPVLPPAPPIPPNERVLDARSVATATPVGALSADGTRVAFVPNARATDCSHAAVWAPSESSITRFVLPAPCRPEAARVREVALAGSRVAWTAYRPENSNECSIAVATAMLASPQPLWLHGAGPNRGGCARDYYHLRGDGDLSVFNDGLRLVRIGRGRQACQQSNPSPQICSTLRRGANAAPVDSVSGALIAVRRPGRAVVLDDRGQLVRRVPFFPADLRAARLDGGRLVVWRFGVLEAYDVATGARVQSHPVPAGSRLVDVDGGIAVLVGGEMITLLRLADGASRAFAPGRAPVLAELEPTGLYYSYATGDGGGRVAFLPRAEADPAPRLG